MSDLELTRLIVSLLALLVSAHLLGHLFARLRQPRVIGEIMAGLLLGPSLLGRVAPGIAASLFFTGAAQSAVLTFVYQLGLLLLMFVSGSETRHLFSRGRRRDVFWLASVGTALPFMLVLVASPWLPMERLMGAVSDRTAMALVIGIAVAVTSIPVISRIFHDLRILHTRFASLVLGVAVIEDIALWAVLAVAMALATTSGTSPQRIAGHLTVTLLYFALGTTAAPALFRRLHEARWNVLARTSPIAYVITVLFAYVALAGALGVSLVFAAFLAGFAFLDDKARFADALDSISKVSFAFFIPVYFAIVGYRLDLGRTFSFALLGTFLFAACVLKIASVWLGGRLAGFSRLDTLNLALAMNARGGPGIVLASVAFDAHLINAPFYTTLVLVAVLTSQAAGAWLDFVLRRGWPLLSGEPADAIAYPDRTEDVAA